MYGTTAAGGKGLGTVYELDAAGAGRHGMDRAGAAEIYRRSHRRFAKRRAAAG